MSTEDKNNLQNIEPVFIQNPDSNEGDNYNHFQTGQFQPHDESAQGHSHDNKQYLIPNNDAYIRNSSITEPTTEKQARFQDLYDTVSPNQNLHSVQDLRQTLQLTLDNELQRYIFGLQNSQKRFQDLEREKAKLAEELRFWQSKSLEAEENQNSDLQFNEQLTNDQLIVIEQAQNLQIDFMELERKKFEKIVQDQLNQVEEWKHKAAEYQERFLTGNRIQFELQSYERRIQQLIEENATKSREVQGYKITLNQLEVTNADVRKLEEELHTVKQMLDHRVNEGLALKAAIESLRGENANSRELVARLKENEARLQAAIDDLTNQLNHLIAFKNAQLKDLQIQHESSIAKIRNSQELEKQNIQSHKKIIEANIDVRQNDINQIGLVNGQIENVLKQTVQSTQNAEIQADQQHIRSDSAELELRETVLRQAALRENEVAKINREHTFNKNVINDKLNVLSRTIEHQTVDLVSTQNALNKTEFDKVNQSIHQKELENRLNGWLHQYDVTRRNQEIDLNNRTIAHNNEIRNVDIVGKVHENALKNETVNTNIVYGVHKQKCEEALIRNNNFHSQLNETIAQERFLSDEASKWLKTTQQIELSKSIELANSLERKQVDVHNLATHCNIQRDQIIRHNSHLSNVVNNKVVENNNLQIINNSTHNLLIREANDAQVALHNSLVFQSVTDDTLKKTVHDSIVHEHVTRSQINNINLVRNSEKGAIVNDINYFKHSANVNNHNSNVLRQSLNSTLRSPYIRYIQY